MLSRKGDNRHRRGEFYLVSNSPKLDSPSVRLFCLPAISETRFPTFLLQFFTSHAVKCANLATLPAFHGLFVCLLGTNSPIWMRSRADESGISGRGVDKKREKEMETAKSERLSGGSFSHAATLHLVKTWRISILNSEILKIKCLLCVFITDI